MEDFYGEVKRQFFNLFNADPVIFRAPGRINLIGEHTDYNDGFVMPAAINKEIVFAIKESTDNVTVIKALDMNETFNVDLENIKSVAKPLWVNYLLGVIHRLQEKGHIIRPFKCIFSGNIPAGSGLSSSAALECGFVYALNSIFNLEISPTEMVHIAQWSEHNYAGVKCGIMDQFSSMMGKKDHVFILDCRSLAYHYFPLKLKEYEILLLDSNVKHSLASSEYNTRRSECEEGIHVLKKFLPEIKNLRDVKPEDIEHFKSELSEKVFSRCKYVTEEIIRVKAAGKDLMNGDLGLFGEKMYATHEGLSKLYEVSCSELDFLVNQTKDNPHVLGARMMGGGFGGCTINIVHSDQGSTDPVRRSIRIPETPP
jgi:galactokinase